MFFLLTRNLYLVFFFFSSRRRHTRCGRDGSSDVCSSDLGARRQGRLRPGQGVLDGCAAQRDGSGHAGVPRVGREPVRGHREHRGPAVRHARRRDRRTDRRARARRGEGRGAAGARHPDPGHVLALHDRRQLRRRVHGRGVLPAGRRREGAGPRAVRLGERPLRWSPAGRGRRRSFGMRLVDPALRVAAVVVAAALGGVTGVYEALLSPLYWHGFHVPLSPVAAMVVAADRTAEGDLIFAGTNWVGLVTLFAGSIAFALGVVPLVRASVAGPARTVSQSSPSTPGV